MTGFLAVLIAIFAAWNPAAVAGREPSMSRQRIGGLAMGATIVALIALFTEPILSALSVSAPTFRTAAGAVLSITGARWLFFGAPAPDSSPDLRIALVDSLTPATVFTAMATSSRDGWLLTVVALAGAVALTIAVGRASPPERVSESLRRGIGGLAVATGIALVYAGIRAV